MPLLKIITLPDPILKTPAMPVDVFGPDVIRLAHDMCETMRHHRNCVGIAAPQIGEGRRMVVIDVGLHPKKHPNHGLLVLVNPVIVSSDGKTRGREGCLSIPDFTGNVTRAERVSVRAFDQYGHPFTIDACGFESVVLQHEIDHLDGILFLDRVSSLKTDVFRRMKA